MKQLFFFLILFNFSILNAQIEDVISLSAFPGDLAINDNDLYFTNYWSGNNKISKIDLTENEPTISDILTISSISGFCIQVYGNDLYYSSPTEGTIYKIDITDTSMTPTVVVTGLNGPYYIALNGNDLYISQGFSSGSPEPGYKISKIDITESSPTVVDVITQGLSGPAGMVFHGNDLYIANAFGARYISKIDITNSESNLITIASGLSRPTDMLVKDDILYICGSSAGKIYKIDLTETVPEVITLVDFNTIINGIDIKGDFLYATLDNPKKIIRFDVNQPLLSTNEFHVENNKKRVFPNPSNAFIQIYDLNEVENYKVYNILGIEVLNGIISNTKKINIQNLTNGLYFLKLESENLIKFIKK